MSLRSFSQKFQYQFFSSILLPEWEDPRQKVDRIFNLQKMLFLLKPFQVFLKAPHDRDLTVIPELL